MSASVPVPLPLPAAPAAPGAAGGAAKLNKSVEGEETPMCRHCLPQAQGRRGPAADADGGDGGGEAPLDDSVMVGG